MFERIHPSSREQLRHLIRLHGLQAVIDTARELVREDAAARLAMPQHREVVTDNVAQVVAGKVPEHR